MSVLAPELSLNQKRCIGEKAFSILCELISAAAPKRIVEFGSGISTVRLAMAFPKIEILSFDHSKKYSYRAAELLRKYAADSRCSISHRPLRLRWLKGRPIVSYEMVKIEGPTPFVIIDGPPIFTIYGREACLYDIYPNIPQGGVVILDDYVRLSEQMIVRHWLKAYPGQFEVESKPIGNTLAILRKLKT